MNTIKNALKKIGEFYLLFQIDGHTKPQGHTKEQIDLYLKEASTPFKPKGWSLRRGKSYDL